jgi:hypothetical protein
MVSSCLDISTTNHRLTRHSVFSRTITMLICLPSCPGTCPNPCNKQSTSRPKRVVRRFPNVFGHPTHRSNRSDVGVQIQMLSQSNNRARVPFHLIRGGRDSAEHCSVAFLPHDATGPIGRRYQLFPYARLETSFQYSKWEVRIR